jgi:chemotaxis protein methyltransferase CheR
MGAAPPAPALARLPPGPSPGLSPDRSPPRRPDLALDVLATDLDEHQLGRAAEARYPAGTLRERPDAWRRAAFDPVDGDELLRAPFRAPVRFARHDVRTAPPAGSFDLLLCRNLAFTCFDDPLQRQVAASFRAALRPGGVLVVGIHERLPDGVPGLTPSSRSLYLATAPAA